MMSQKRIKEFLDITLGVTLLSLGFYFFLLPLNLVIGGMMGLAVIIEYFIPISTSVFLFIANIALLVVGYMALGKNFFLKTIYGTLLMPVIIFILEHLASPDLILGSIEQNPLLIASLGGSLGVGIGLGLAIRNGATTGGIDVVQNIIHKFMHVPFSTAMYATDGVIVAAGMLVFGIERGIYAIASIYLIGYIIDLVSIKGRRGRTAYIITEKADIIKEAIFSEIDRGVTIIDAVGGYSNTPKKMLICTLNQREYYQLKRLVEERDKNAFMIIGSTKEVVGKGFSIEEV